jgi:hypothetical protein
VNEDELRDLAERTQQIHDLVSTIGWGMFVDRAHAEITKKQKAILGGNLSADDYRRDTGWVAGALAMLALPAVTAQEYQRQRQAYEEQKQVEQDEVEAYGRPS